MFIKVTNKKSFIQIKNKYFYYSILFIYLYNMSKLTTITLNDKVKEAAKKKAKDSHQRGGLSGYIEYLILKDLNIDTSNIK